MLDELTDGHLLVYTDHLKAVKADMEVRFSDLDQLVVPDWVMEPLQHDAASSEEAIQESLIDLQNDAEAMATFRTSGWRALWLTHGQRFPQLWERVHLESSSLSPHPILWSRASAKLCTYSQSTATA